MKIAPLAANVALAVTPIASSKVTLDVARTGQTAGRVSPYHAEDLNGCVVKCRPPGRQGASKTQRRPEKDISDCRFVRATSC
jgi:hypothetical protein